MFSALNGSYGSSIRVTLIRPLQGRIGFVDMSGGVATGYRNRTLSACDESGRVIIGTAKRTGKLVLTNQASLLA